MSKLYKYFLPFVATTIVTTILVGVFSVYFFFQYSHILEKRIYTHIDETGEIDLYHICDDIDCKGLFYEDMYYGIDPETKSISHKSIKDVKLSDELYKHGIVSLRKNLSFIIPIQPDGLNTVAYFYVNITKFIPNFLALYVILLIILNLSTAIIIHMVLVKDEISRSIELTKDKATLQFNNLMFYIENLNHEVNSPLFILSRKIKELKNKTEGENRNFEIIFNSVEQIAAVMQRTREVKRINKASEDRTVYDLIESTILTVSVMRAEHIYNDTDKRLDKYYLNQDLLTNGTFINILTNHIKNSIEAYADTLTSEYIKCKKNKLIFTFSDNGNGIPKEIRKNVFDKGFSTKGDKMVRGSGLSINKYIIESIGGHIKLVNSDEGTRFEIMIPVKKEGE